ncbi:MAG: type II secretion system minor pseudopilin GspK [Myxococcaceae bacterium]
MKKAPNRKRERGIALLIAIISIAILTAVAVDFAYSSRVDLQLASNQRDEVRAYYLAKSGVGLSRLMLKFQKQLDGMMGAIPGLDPSALSGLGLPPEVANQVKGLLPGGGGGLNIQLWANAKIDCYMLQGLVASDDGKGTGTGSSSSKSPSSKKFGFDEEFPELGADMQKKSFGGFEGCFDAKITDEEKKFNLNKLDSGALAGQKIVPSFLGVFGAKEYEFLYEKEDSNGVKVNPQDILVNLHDWIDADNVQATLNLSGTGDPFPPGFSDENYGYDKYNPRYKPKNSYFDSVDEIYLVHGVNDRWMAAFGDNLTVYPDINSKQTLDLDSPQNILAAVLAIQDPLHPDPRLRDPIFVDQLIQKIQLANSMASMLPGMKMTVSQFIAAVSAAGIQVPQGYTTNAAVQSPLSDKSSTFRIESTGTAGLVTKKIIAVVRADQNLGKLVYWREE